MSILELVLVGKILVTVLFVIFPLLAQSKERIGVQYGVRIESKLIFKLYISAIIALLTNYSFGLMQSLDGHFPETVVYVGIVSNVGATAFLLEEKFLNKEYPAKVADITAITVFGVIGLLFVASLLWQSSFTYPVW